MTVTEAFHGQSIGCTALGSPFMGRLMELCANRLTRDTEVGRHVLDWPGDPAPSADSLPLRLAGALHALKLEGLALSAVYPPNEAPDDVLWDEVESAFETHETHILTWLTSAPQTNEIRRSAVLLAALAETATRYPAQDVELFELGASAGLNLPFDRYRLEVPGLSLGPEDATVVLNPDWSGPLPAKALPKVTARQGTDLNPLDPTNPGHRLRLLAYLWPDQPHRQRLTEAAIDEIARTPHRIDRMDAGDWLTAQLATPSDHLRVVFHTVAWQYFPQATAHKATEAMENAPSPLVQIGLEADGKGDGGAVTLTHWPEGRTEFLGRADFHGRWINWH